MPYTFNKSKVVNAAMDIYKEWNITMEEAMDIALANEIMDQKYDNAASSYGGYDDYNYDDYNY